MHRLFCGFLLFLLLQPLLHAQTSPPALEWMFKVHPSVLIQSNRPSIQGSLELKLYDKLGLEFTYGKRYMEIYPYLLDYDRKSLVANAASNNYFYDVKWYHPTGRTPYESPFFVFTFGQIEDVKNRRIRYYEDLILLNDYFSIHQAINVYAFGYGTVINYNWMMVEAVFSAGVKSMDVQWQNNEYEEGRFRAKRDLFVWELPGTRWLPYLNASLKIGFSTNKKISKIFAEDIQK